MNCRVIACDFDGTGATNGHPVAGALCRIGGGADENATDQLACNRRKVDDQGRLFTRTIERVDEAFFQLCELPSKSC